ncbi:MAG: hypothetical protein CM15mP74_07650 [Halieaceae bacterium]|nr:MAG: hypothetical protein CM15mP74_07650 [Halieaceae bacterium]
MTQINELLDFLRESVTPYHAVRGMCKRLEQAGFESVERFDPSAMVPGRGYFMTKQGSSWWPCEPEPKNLERAASGRRAY